MDDHAEANRAAQAQLYGEPLHTLIPRLRQELGLNQGEIADVIGISAAMLSQLVSGRRMKIGNPVASSRLQSLHAVVQAAAAGRIQRSEIPAALAQIREQSTPFESTGIDRAGDPSATTVVPRRVVAAIQELLRSVASAPEILDAALTLEHDHPGLAEVLRVYGTARTDDAVRHYTATVGNS